MLSEGGLNRCRDIGEDIPGLWWDASFGVPYGWTKVRLQQFLLEAT